MCACSSLASNLTLQLPVEFCLLSLGYLTVCVTCAHDIRLAYEVLYCFKNLPYA